MAVKYKSNHRKSSRNQPSRLRYAGAAAIGLLFLFVALINQWNLKYDIELYFALYSAMIFVFSFAGKANRAELVKSVGLMFVILTAHTLLFFAGLFYSMFPKFALQQFFLNIGGWFMFSAAYIFFMRDRENIRKLSVFLSAGIAIVTFVSIELATSRLLFGFFKGFSGLISAVIPPDYGSFETNTRITSVMGNPNTYAPIAAIGLFLSVWLSGQPGCRKIKEAGFMGVAVLTGTGLVLSFSMGTMVMLIPSLIGILFFAPKGARKAYAFPLAYSLIFSAAGAAAVFALLRSGVLPSIAVLLISAGAGFLYVILKPLSLPAGGLSRGRKLVLYSVSFLILAAAAVAAVGLKGPYPLKNGEGFRRALALDAGTYVLSIESDGEYTETEPPVTLEISSMSLTEAALKEQTRLVQTAILPGQQTEFTVPEDSAAVFFRFSAAKDMTISRASVTGGTGDREIPLRYTLLPEFVVNRMQAIWVNDNAIQRFVFFRDGLRIGMTSPVIGLGGGAYEGKIFGAADYYYETVHTHNHYIQCFIDGGVIGFALFAALAIFAVLCLFRAKREKNNADIFPFLAGAILMIFLHSLIEVDFAAPAFKALAAVMLALLAAYYEKSYPLGKPSRKIAVIGVTALTAVTIAIALGRANAIHAVRTQQSLEALEQAVRLDPFNSDDYTVSYLLSTMNMTDDALVTARANGYLEKIESRPISPDTAVLLTQYYLFRTAPDYARGIELAEYYIREKKVNPNAWDEILSIYVNRKAGASDEGNRQIAESVQRLADKLDELNASLPKKIEPKLMDVLLNP